TLPLLRFLPHATAARSRQRVVLGAAPELARLPFRRNPAGQLELVQSGIQRSIADLQFIARDLLESLADRPTVLRAYRENLQQQQVQCSLYEVRRLAHRLITAA